MLKRFQHRERSDAEFAEKIYVFVTLCALCALCVSAISASKEVP